MRLFIALKIPENILDNIGRFQRELRGTCTDRNVRWVPVTNMHINFLGDTVSAAAEKVKDAMKEAVRVIEPFYIEIYGAGVFPSKKNPRVLWIGCREPEKSLARLKTRLDRRLGKLGFKTESRKFRPHLTLGRVRSNEGLEPVIKCLYDSAVEFGSFKADFIYLVESLLDPSGARYRTIYEQKI